MKAPDSTMPECCELDQSDAELVLIALSHAVSYVLEERSPEDRRATEALARRFNLLRARLLNLVATRAIRAPDAEEEQVRHA